jgi:oligopeptide transport system ATP-binding protein
MLVRIVDPTAGKILFRGVSLTDLDATALKPYRRRMQFIFQDPFTSLNPRKSIRHILSQPFCVHEGGRPSDHAEKVRDLLEVVGLSPAYQYIDRHPHEFSGGQRQRIAIARALALRPEFVVADEPVSALDVSVRAQILTLMKRLQREFGITYLFITHDLGVVRSISQRVAVMYLGKLVELGGVEAIFGSPQHPYTEALLSATPIPHPRLSRSRRRIVLTGEVPSPVNPPPGCRFHTRCPIAEEICRREEPPLLQVGNGHWAACHLRRP